MTRIARFQVKIKNNKKIHLFFINTPSNLNYLTNTILFSSHNQGFGLITLKSAFLFVSPLMAEQLKTPHIFKASRLKNNLKIIPLKNKNTFYAYLKSELFARRQLKKKYNFSLGFEENGLTWKMYQKLKEKLKIKLVPTKNMVENLRMIKDDKEIKNIKKAVLLTKKAFQYIKTQLKPGRQELEISWLLEKFLRENNVALAFPIIVASGPNSAVPHYQTGERKLETNDIVLIDAGCKFDGYCADMTRTFFIGKPKLEWQKVYKIVKESQQKALNFLNTKYSSLNTSIKANQIDKICRDYIKNKGYGKYFIHRTGHGLGLDIHEKPYISPQSKQTLKKGMTFTIEPGIYLPGKFGIRIEDTIIL